MSAALLERFALLAGLGREARLALARAIESVEVDAGTLLFAEGDPAEGLVLLVEGRVRVASQRAPEAAAELGPGTALGAFSLVERGLREARVETLSRSRLLVLRRDAYEQLAVDAPSAACQLLEGILRDTASLLRDGIGRGEVRSVDPALASN